MAVKAVSDDDQNPPAHNDNFNILLIGRTSFGKSQTGNKLLQIKKADYECQVSDAEAIRQAGVNEPGAMARAYSYIWHPYEALKSGIRYLKPRKDEDQAIAAFTVAEPGASTSCTSNCAYLVNTMEKVGVLDTPGLGDSKEATNTDLSIERINLRLIRKILIQQTVENLKFQRVLYFMPFRAPPGIADGYIITELRLLNRLIGSDIFRVMVLVMTVNEEYNELLCDDSTGELTPKTREKIWDKTKNAYDKAFKAIGIDVTPPIIFIGINETGVSILRKVKDTYLNDFNQDGFQVEFKKDRCCKCTAELEYLPEELEDKEQDGIIYVTDDKGKKCEYRESMCHPMFVPEFTNLQRFLGVAAHIATLGTVAFYQSYTKKIIIPGLFDTDEICVECGGKPGISEPCTLVETETKMYKGNPIVCKHSNSL